MKRMCGAEKKRKRDKQKTTSLAPTNKWMGLPFSLSLRPGCCSGIQEVSLGDRSFIVM